MTDVLRAVVAFLGTFVLCVGIGLALSFAMAWLDERMGGGGSKEAPTVPTPENDPWFV